MSVSEVTRAPTTVEMTRNWLTGAFVKPEDIMAACDGAVLERGERVIARAWCCGARMVGEWILEAMTAP